MIRRIRHWRARRALARRRAEQDQLLIDGMKRFVWLNVLVTARTERRRRRRDRGIGRPRKVLRRG